MFEQIFYIMGIVACGIYIADNWQQLRNLFKAAVRD